MDTASFLSAYRATFEDGIYSFEPADEAPVIIDGGANVGLTTLFWKSRWPNAKILAFEPDPEIFEALEWNCHSHGYSDVKLHQKGLWSENTTVDFCPDGADGGHVDTFSSDKKRNDNFGRLEVPVVRLSPFLDRPVDLVKLDIEGAETEVLLDCQDDLHRVKRLFVEYHSYIGQKQRLDKIINVLLEAEFRVHIQPEFFTTKPFIDRTADGGMDNRINIFAYRDE